jgi:hypothetical protein
MKYLGNHGQIYEIFMITYQDYWLIKKNRILVIMLLLCRIKFLGLMTCVVDVWLYTVVPAWLIRQVGHIG